MPTTYGYTNYVELQFATDNGTTLSWTAANSQNTPWSVVDANDDSDLDIGSDYLEYSDLTFSGYYYTDASGNEHPIFVSVAPHGNEYFIPYNSADYDLGSELTGPGSTSDQADNFVPLGGPFSESHSYTHFIRLTATDSGSELTWSSTFNSSNPRTILDQKRDGNLDIGIDGADGFDWVFTGYYYTHTDGSEHPIYYSALNGYYFIPYNQAETDLSSELPDTGSTTNYADNFVPEGGTFCFAAGSLIATPAGEVAVERLRIGDTVLTAEGRAVPVKWIGRQMVSTRFGPAERLMPVRFAAGSLGQGVPHGDLIVTADHGMLVDGVICHAGALVNGTTITRVPLREMGESYTVYHIETENHEIILANGAPAETFIDNVSRRVFDNYAEFEALYGDVPEMAELPYPRAMSARQVPGAIRARLAPPKVA